MSHEVPEVDEPPRHGLLGFYQRTPLYVRIIVALVLGVIVGECIGKHADIFKPFSKVVLQLLGALATPLIFIAVTQAILKAKVGGKTAVKLLSLLLLNTVVAILIGLTVANIIQPGRHVPPDVHVERKAPDKKPFDPVEDLLGKLPSSILKPLADNDIMSVIIIAVAVGAGLRVVRRQRVSQSEENVSLIERLLDTGFQLTMVILHWVLELVPLAVFGVVAQKVGTEGFKAFSPLIWFMVAVLLALTLQAGYYLLRVRYGSWVSPRRFLTGGSEALLTAFSTASSAATLPITFRCMREKIGVREESASLGIMCGGAFNHDGTALYEAMAALFISQFLGKNLGIGHQIIVVFMAITASVGAAGIPEAGLVTMIAVFHAVNLPIEYIPMLLLVDWFLDRCRTAINVMGDMSVTCLLDGKTPPVPSAELPVTSPALAAETA